MQIMQILLVKSIVSYHIAQLDKQEILALTLGSNTRVGAFTQSIDKASPRHHTSSPKVQSPSEYFMPTENRDCAPEWLSLQDKCGRIRGVFMQYGS